MTDPALVARIAEVSAAHRMGTEMKFYRNGTCKLPRCRCGKSMHPNAHPRHLAEAIAAAVHPRITTVEQLNAMPVRTVLKEEFETGNGAIWERWHADTWVRLDSAPHIPGRIPFLPATLLYTPGDTE